MSTIASRLDEFIKFKGLSTRQFEDATGLSNGAIFTALKTDEAYFEGKKDKPGGISSHNIAKILQTYPELNAEWLVLGVGEMLKKEETPIAKSTDIKEKNGVDFTAEFKSINDKLDTILKVINR